MSVRKFSTASILSPAYKNSKVWDGESFPGYMDAIATAVVDSSGTTSIEFTNIPQNYTHLQIRAIAKASGSNFNPKMQFNSDTNTNYSWHVLYGEGSGVGTVNAGATQSFIYNSIMVIDANMYNVFIINILDYANTNKFKTTMEMSGCDRNGGGEIAAWSGNWRSTSAISSIKFSNGTFSQYSQYALYGIRG